MSDDRQTYVSLEHFFADIKIYQKKRLIPFFSEYIQIVGQRKVDLLKSLNDNLPTLFDGLIPKRQEFIKNNKRLAVDFNIFTIIGRSGANPEGYSRLETITHTPFLKDLLDPLGTHGQRDLFYREFISSLEGLEDKKLKNFQDCEPQYMNVQSEENNIDILIRSFKPEYSFGVIIENKINNAQDQSKQLKRYYKEVRNSWGFNDEQIVIVYLTPDGRRPTEFSLTEKERDRLFRENVLFCLSVKHITKWLEKCLKECMSDKVQVVLSQYLDILRRVN